MEKKPIIGLILVGLIIWFFWSQSREEWTLMVCDEKLNAAECYSNSYVISGYESERECMSEGASRFKTEGFECGKNCQEKDGFKICELICNASGCQE